MNRSDGYKVSSLCDRDGCFGCVGVKIDDNGVSVKDTKTGQTLAFTAEEWAVFLDGAKKGEFDVAP